MIFNLYEDILNIVYSELSNGELFILKSTCKFFNESIRIRLTRREAMTAIMKTKNIEYIESSKNLISKNTFSKLLYKYCDNIDYLMKAIKNPLIEECAKYGNLKFLRYLHKNNYKFNIWAYINTVKNGNLKILKFLDRNELPIGNICNDAAKYGYLDILKYGHKNGFRWSLEATIYAAENGHLDCLKYLHENGCDWNGSCCDDAAKNGHLDCLKYLFENGCEQNDDICDYAVENGHLDCLKYLRENGCDWNDNICDQAAYNGHLDVLMYLHENGCTWD